MIYGSCRCRIFFRQVRNISLAGPPFQSFSLSGLQTSIGISDKQPLVVLPVKISRKTHPMSEFDRLTNIQARSSQSFEKLYNEKQPNLWPHTAHGTNFTRLDQFTQSIFIECSNCEWRFIYGIEMPEENSSFPENPVRFLSI